MCDQEVPIEPDKFDLIVLGTGLVESLIAGAAAKSGKSVLHLDHAPHYGSQWATVSFSSLLELIEASKAAVNSQITGENTDFPQTHGQISPPPSTSDSPITSCPVEPLCPWDTSRVVWVEVDDLVGEHAGGTTGLLGNTRKYNLDLCAPRMCYAADTFVDVLIRSGAHQYMEFKALEATLVLQSPQGGAAGGSEAVEAVLTPVPASRAAMFKDRSLTPVDKRMLMKFLQVCMETEVPEEEAQHAGTLPAPVSESSEAGLVPQSRWGQEPSHSDTPAQEALLQDPAAPFLDILTRHKLSPAVQRLLMYTIALIGPDQNIATSKVTVLEGVRAIQLHMRSTGRFGAGQGAFLLPLYGAGELPQAFCRVAAVKGALYVLRRSVTAIHFTPTPPPPLPLSHNNQNDISDLTPPCAPVGDIANSGGGDGGNIITTAAATEASSSPGEKDVPASTSGATNTSEGTTDVAPAPLPPSPCDPGEARWCCGVQTQGGQVLRCSALVASSAYAPALRRFHRDTSSGEVMPRLGGRGVMARAICITDRSLLEGKTQVLVVVPSSSVGVQHAVRVLQVGTPTNAAPDGKYVVYLSLPLTEDEVRAGLDTSSRDHQDSETRQEGAPKASTSPSLGVRRLKEVVSSLFDRFVAPPPALQPPPASPEDHTPPLQSKTSEDGATAAPSKDTLEESITPQDRLSETSASATQNESNAMSSSPSDMTGKAHTTQMQNAVTAETSKSLKPMLLWAVYFEHRIHDDQTMFPHPADPIPGPGGSNLVVCSGVDCDGGRVDVRAALAEAKTGFTTLFPGDHFYPEPPPQDEPALDEDEDFATLNQDFPNEDA